MQSPPALRSERSTSPSFSASQVAKQVGISHGSATSTVGMLPLPDAMHWPERPMSLSRVERAFQLVRGMVPSAAESAGPPSIDVKTELPTVLTLLGLQWRPNWADTLRRSGVAALREVLLEARKRWLKLYFGAEDFSFSGSAQLLTAQYSKEAYAAPDLYEHSQLDVRQQLSPLLSTDDDDQRTGQPMDAVQLPELCHIVCMLLQFEALAVYTAQWSVACSTSTASLLASPGPGSFRRLSMASSRRMSKVFARPKVRSSQAPLVEQLSSTPPNGSPGASGSGDSSEQTSGTHAAPVRGEYAHAPAAHAASAGDDSGCDTENSSSRDALASQEDNAAARSSGGGGLFPDEDDASSSEPSIHQNCRLPHGLVFLGGACGPTSWRRDIAIPALGAAKIPFFNPQVEEWSPELVDVEAAKKAEAGTLLFVISERTRSIASMIEAAEHITAGQRHVVLVIRMVPEAAIGRDEVSTVAASTQDSSSPVRQAKRPSPMTDLTGLTASEQKDLNRGRTYLADIAERHGVRVFGTVDAAVKYLVKEYSFTWNPSDEVSMESSPQNGLQRESSCESGAMAVKVSTGDSFTVGPGEGATSSSASAAVPSAVSVVGPAAAFKAGGTKRPAVQVPKLPPPAPTR